MRHTFRRAAGLALALAALAAQAETYRCGAPGATHFSDRPCDTGARNQMAAYGPARTSAMMTAAPRLVAAPKAAEHTKYLGSACASISEAIRTGPARGVRGDVLRGLRDEYEQKCSFEDQEARRRLGDERSDERAAQVAQRDSAKDEQRQIKARAEQCAGMRDVIGLRQKRKAELNASELDGLATLQKTYDERCLAR